MKWNNKFAWPLLVTASLAAAPATGTQGQAPRVFHSRHIDNAVFDIAQGTSAGSRLGQLDALVMGEVAALNAASARRAIVRPAVRG